ncbi:hypothetical protein [Bacteroides sp.]|uniref:hypothetical protein n=1 Tax=Bacteroides sp. TaxID=29523 RepID=UPI00261F9693|nr:hypothetical protein [Bacteroides sp.]MDD3041305.1 hypothetical protein [Bacteroides sp.]
MASKVSKRSVANIKGILEHENGVLQIRVEDIETPYVLSDFLKDFVDLEVRMSVVHMEDLD